jgi:hypothetical protein
MGSNRSRSARGDPESVPGYRVEGMRSWVEPISRRAEPMLGQLWVSQRRFRPAVPLLKRLLWFARSISLPSHDEIDLLRVLCRSRQRAAWCHSLLTEALTYPKPRFIDQYRPAFDIYRPRLEPCRAGHDICRSGFDICRPGIETCRSGIEICRPGIETCRPGIETCRLTLVRRLAATSTPKSPSITRSASPEPDWLFSEKGPSQTLCREWGEAVLFC